MQNRVVGSHCFEKQESTFFSFKGTLSCFARKGGSSHIYYQLPVTTSRSREPDGFEVGGASGGEGLEACSRLLANCGEAWRRFVNLDEVLRCLVRLCAATFTSAPSWVLRWGRERAMT